MDITFSYAVTGMKKVASLNGLTDVVTKVSFLYTGQSGETIIEYPFTDILIPPPNTETFVPIENLTEAEVLTWVQECYPIGPVTQAITQQISDIQNPDVEVPTLPWQV